MPCLLKGGSWRIRPPHQTDIRNQSPVILGLVGLLRRAVASCVPLAIPPNQKYNPWGAPHVTHRCHIAFNSHGENLLAAFPAFTLLCTHSLLSRFQIMSYSTTSNRFCQHFSLHLTHWYIRITEKSSKWLILKGFIKRPSEAVSARLRIYLIPRLHPCHLERLFPSHLYSLLYSLFESTYTVYIRVKDLSSLFCKIIEKCLGKLPKCCKL